MKLSEILSPDKIIPNLSVDDKDKSIAALLELFKNDSRIIDLVNVKNSVLEREKIMSTGVGHGFAIPHGKTNAVNEIIAAFAKTTEPLEFDSLDGQPVRLIFLLVGKENSVSVHIKLLSRISRMMNNEEFRNKLLAADSSEEIYDLFKKEEANI
ncbi:MAG: PTS sugar transporter subunit IIA [Ignavibacteriae bacterium]|nr:PTS sugar transporter subunit IIA [Ignavibacteriota bacterium]NOG97669.1 PTS sugar transporter subunit IIA [Ignavibacteriota bacterium]